MEYKKVIVRKPVTNQDLREGQFLFFKLFLDPKTMAFIEKLRAGYKPETETERMQFCKLSLDVYTLAKKLGFQSVSDMNAYIDMFGTDNFANEILNIK